MKLKFKLLLAAVVACLFAFLLATFSDSAETKLATVLSVEPIKSNRLVEYQNCSVSGVLESFKQESLSRYHPAQRECKMVLMIETLQGKSFPSLMDRENRTCVTTKKVEQVIVGYDVVYRIGDLVGKVRTSYAPGMLIPLNQEGRLELTVSTSTVCETLRSDVKELLPFYCLKQNELPIDANLPSVLELQPGKNTYGFFD